MSEDRRKMYSKKGTGTVPKIKYAKNTIRGHESDHNLLPNNLGSDSYVPRRTERLPRASMHAMEHPLDDNNQNSVYQADSRRNSTDKCDNITKYPDKKQIEDKLNQIRECLNVTSSIVSNMKNSDEQQYDELEREEIEKTHGDLKDSEEKLTNMLIEIERFEGEGSKDSVKPVENGIQLEKKVEQANRQLELLLEQENLLRTLQLKAENQLREARQAQSKLLGSAHQNEDSDVNNAIALPTTPSKKDNQSARDSEERWAASRLENQMETLQKKIVQLRDTNDNRSQLVQILDKRDSQLQSEHSELQGKLRELQNKKRQVDRLVSQLQNMTDESEEDDMGSQVRKIVAMKEQLGKLKDMLEIVKSTEGHSNESDAECPSKSHNLIQNDVRSNNQFFNEEARASNVKDKQVNKKTVNAQERERLRLQAELQAKKRELEELMCKHKAASSNLNQDVQCEYKPDFNNICEGVNYRFYPADKTGDDYSSDEGEAADEDANEYSEVNSSGEASNVQPVPAMPPIEVTTLDDYLKNDKRRQFAFCPERNPADTRASSSVGEDRSGTANVVTSTQRTPKEQARGNRTQTQKQLELIRSVCDSMLEGEHRNVQRNNLTPSPLYSEPRFSSPIAAVNNNNNVLPREDSSPWTLTGVNSYNHNGIGNPPNYDSNAVSYQNWLATNTLQTQAYMLSTLNQCCQMLWLQQREIASLRHNLQLIQEKLQIPPDQILPPPPTSTTAPPSAIPAPPLSSLYHHHHPASHPARPAAVPSPSNPHGLSHANADSNTHLNNAPPVPPAAAQLWGPAAPGAGGGAGVALNNQVAPGNRANNYWDNFRSYSRQNLLSSKSNEQQPLSTNDRPNNSMETLYPFATTATAQYKRNTIYHHETAPASSAENTPRRRALAAAVEAAPPPESSSNPTAPPAAKANESAAQWAVSSKPSKMFEELRENVYKEVASLISANQGRPHFLLQLFRDLQLVSSDPLRRQTLQSIQSLVSTSLVASGAGGEDGRGERARQQSNEISESSAGNNDIASSHFPSTFSTHSSGVGESNIDPDCPAYLSEVLTFLNLHSEEVLQQNLVDYLKDLLVDSTFSSVFANSTNPKDGIIQKHFACLVSGAFEQFKGKKVQDVRLEILQTIEELLRGEISLIRLMSLSEVSESTIDHQRGASSLDLTQSGSEACSTTLTETQPPIQNGDLAEADQSRLDADDEALEEELQMASEEADASGIDFTLGGGIGSEAVDSSMLFLAGVGDTEFSEQGLDQVPTRLNSHCPPKVNTSRDRSTSSRSDTEQL